MEKQALVFEYKNGRIEGMYLNAGTHTPLVIIANGHNGFYNYGMFPYLQQKLAENEISSFSFNYSHGGIEGENDVFTRLDLYEKNCMRLEKEDILFVLKNFTETKTGLHTGTLLLTHSLGGIPTAFAAKEAVEIGISIAGVLFVSAVSKLDFWSEAVIKQWRETGVYYIRNNRTQQELPQGREFLSEVLAAGSTWNVTTALHALKMPIYVIHGGEDEAVPAINGIKIFNCCGRNNTASEIKIIEGATHTFNTRHPFTATTPELEALSEQCIKWIKNLTDE
jgi:uncharacterized protein